MKYVYLKINCNLCWQCGQLCFIILLLILMLTSIFYAQIAIANVQLSSNEKEWIKNHPVITVGSDATWAPVEFINKKGIHAGLSIDYINKIASLTGLRFQWIKEKSWKRILEKAKQKKIDMLSAVAITEERKKYFYLTRPYIVTPLLFFSTRRSFYVSNIKDLEGKRIGVVEAYAGQKILLQSKLQLDVVPVKSIVDGLQKLRSNKIDYYIDTLLVTSYYISKFGYSDVKVVGESPLKYNLAMGVRKDWPELQNILQKSLDAISSHERNKIYKKWISVKLEKQFDYSLFWKILAGVVLLLIVILYWNYILNKSVAAKTRALKNELQERLKTESALRESELRFRTIFNQAIDPVYISDLHGNFVNVNKRACDVLGYSLNEILQLKVWDIDGIYNDRSNVTSFLKQLVVEKSVIFSTEHRKRDGTIFPVELSMGLIDLDEKQYVIGIARDVSERKKSERILHEHQQKIDAIFESSKDWIWIINLAGKHTFSNPAVETILGFTADEVIGKDSLLMMHPEDGEKTKQIMPQWIDSKSGWEGQVIRWKHKNGDWVFLESNASPILDSTGVLMGFMGVDRDISERIEMENKLYESEAYHRELYERAQVGLFNTSLSQARVINCNERYLELFGFLSFEEASNYDLSTLYASEDGRERVKKLLAQNEIMRNEEIEFRTKNGTTFWGQISVTLKKDTDITDGVIVDITDKKIKDSKIRESEEMYRTLFETSSDGIGIISDVFLEGNEKYVEMFGATPETFFGKSPVDFSPEFQPDGMASAVKAKMLIDAAMSGKPQYFEWLHVRPDGTLWDAEITLNKVLIGGEVRLQVTARDVTGRNAMQKEKEKLMEQLAHSQKMEAIGNLAGGLAHDFSNILNGIIGSTDLLKMQFSQKEYGDAGKINKYLDVIHDASFRATDMIKQLLSLSKGYSMKNTLVDINRSVKNVIKICKNTFSKSIEIDFTLLENKSFINGDPTQIEQVILNLCVNASHAMTTMRNEDEPEGGLLAITVSKIMADEFFVQSHGIAKPDIPYLIISISDTGVGMDDRVKEKIFNPFYTTKEDSGTGLGLSMVYAIVKEHGGFVDVYSEFGVGSNFKVFLPEVIDVEVGFANTQMNKIIPGTGNVLIIDDEEIVRISAEGILAAAGYTITLAETPFKGIELYKQHHHELDAVILDMAMPGMSGLEVLKQIRTVNASIPILLSSGNKEDQRVKKSIAMGVESFLEKPYSAALLTKALKELLENREFKSDVLFEKFDNDRNVAVKHAKNVPVADIDISLITKELRVRLKEALLSLNVEAIDNVLIDISNVDKSLAQTLKKYTKNFDYKSILNALENE